VAKYAGASAAQVEISRLNGNLRVAVLDNGVGGADPSLGWDSADWRTGYPRSVGTSGWTPRQAGERGCWPRFPAMPEQAPGPGPGPESPAIRVVLADDSLLFREGLARVLADNGFTVVGQAGDAGGLHTVVAHEQPDVVVTDIRMPPTNSNDGLLAAQRIRAEHPGVGVLVLSQYVETRQAIRLLQHAPQRVGYLLKDRVSDIPEFAETVRRIARSGSAIDPDVVAQLLRRRGEDSALDELTGRERDILALIAEGRPTTPSASGCSSPRRPSRPTSGRSSPSWACCPGQMTTGGSLRCSCTSGKRAASQGAGLMRARGGLLEGHSPPRAARRLVDGDCLRAFWLLGSPRWLRSRLGRLPGWLGQLARGGWSRG
jgi:DNA-binding NarL/FixJ family response regulator